MSTIPEPDPPGQPLPTLPFTTPAPSGPTLAAPPTADDPPIPDIPGFVIHSVLGRGGAGIVYLATDLRLDRAVALKMLLSGTWATSDEKRRLRQEAESLARLSNPGIVRIHATGEHEGRLWLCLELCPGGSLHSRLRGPMPARDAALLLERLARAVHAAHTAGIVHRDLKPANILFGDDGLPRVTDFGIARRLGQTLHTNTGAILGTPTYMAPEQARGDVRGIGPHTDIWALGVLLYECLTGRPPFRSADAMDTVIQVLNDDPVPPSRLQARLPGDIETIAMKCLEKDPKHRFASAEALADDLAAFADGRPIRARPVGLLERAAKWAKRRPAVASLLAACLFLFVAGFVLVTWGFVVARHEEAKARAALDRAEEALYRNRIALAEREWLAHNVLLAREVLASCPVERRGWEWGYLSWLCEGGVKTWRGHTGRVLALAVSGGRVASAGMDGTIRLWDANGQAPPRLRAEGLPHVMGLAFSPDGKSLAAACQDGRVRIYVVADESRPFTIAAHAKPVGDVAWHPHGGMLASCGEDGRIAFWDAATRKPLGGMAGHADTISRIAFDRDGQRLASAGFDGVAIVWDVKERKAKTTCEGHRGAVLGLDFSPDGAALVTSGHDGTIRLWDAATGDSVKVIRGHRNLVNAVRFSPDGRRLASASHDRTVRVWERATSKELLVLAGHAVAVQLAAFDSFGHLFSAGGDGLVKMWDAEREPTAITRTSGSGAVRGAGFCREGLTVASLAEDGKVRLWDVATTEPCGTRSVQGVSLSMLAVSPEGELAAAADRAVYLLPDATQSVRLAQHKGEVVALAWGKGGLLASLSAEEQVQVWDAAGKQVAAWRCHTDVPTAACFDPVRSSLYTAGKDGQLFRWAPRTGEKLASAKLPEGEARALAMSPDGKRIVVCGSGGVAHLFAADLAGLPEAITGHTGAVHAAAFSPDGKRLLTAGADGLVKLRDASGAEILTLRGHDGPVHCVSWSRDGRMVASGGEDETLRAWPGDVAGP